MCSTCDHVQHMKMIQIRNVPEDLHRSLKERAAREGTTMSDLILAELPRLANKPSGEQLLARVRARTPVPGAPAADLIAAERAGR
jgi:plasmid stability protein